MSKNTKTRRQHAKQQNEEFSSGEHTTSVSSGNICRHCSWASHRWRDWSHETSVRHLGDDGERSEPDGEHGRQRYDTGEDV